MAQGFAALERCLFELNARIRTEKLLIATSSNRQVWTFPDLERMFQQKVELDCFLLLKADLLEHEVEKANKPGQRMRFERDEEGRLVHRMRYFPRSAMEVEERQERLRDLIAALPTLKLHSKVLQLKLRRKPVSRAQYWSLYVTIGFGNIIPHEKLTQFYMNVFKDLKTREDQAQRNALDDTRNLPLEGKQYCTFAHALAAAHRAGSMGDIVCKDWVEPQEPILQHFLPRSSLSAPQFNFWAPSPLPSPPPCPTTPPFRPIDPLRQAATSGPPPDLDKWAWSSQYSTGQQPCPSSSEHVLNLVHVQVQNPSTSS